MVFRMWPVVCQDRNDMCQVIWTSVWKATGVHVMKYISTFRMEQREIYTQT